MNLAYRLANIISKPAPPAPVRDYRGAFGLLDGSIINVEGINYVPQHPSLRVRLHNWLIRVGERKDAGGRNTIRAYLVNFLYDIANLCCIIADRLSPTTDDIWRERQWRQFRGPMVNIEHYHIEGTGPKKTPAAQKEPD